MSTSVSVVTAVTFLWLGMVFAISFIEAPLKFQAPGITIPLGLGIGRLVFRALNAVETVLAIVVIVAVALTDWPGIGAPVAIGVAAGCLAIQVIFVRPKLTARSDAVLAGGDHTKRSNAHYVYVVFEVAKVAALITLGVFALTA